MTREATVLCRGCGDTSPALADAVGLAPAARSHGLSQWGDRTRIVPEGTDQKAETALMAVHIRS